MPGGIGRFIPCAVGANHCRLRHIGWEKCGHGLTSGPPTGTTNEIKITLVPREERTVAQGEVTRPMATEFATSGSESTHSRILVVCNRPLEDGGCVRDHGQIPEERVILSALQEESCCADVMV